MEPNPRTQTGPTSRLLCCSLRTLSINLRLVLKFEQFLRVRDTDGTSALFALGLRGLVSANSACSRTVFADASLGTSEAGCLLPGLRRLDRPSKVLGVSLPSFRLTLGRDAIREGRFRLCSLLFNSAAFYAQGNPMHSCMKTWWFSTGTFKEDTVACSVWS